MESLTFFIVFVTYCLLDGFYCWYTLAITERNKLKASNIGSIMYAMTAVGTINYVENVAYIIPMVMGAWVGTYASLHIEEVGIKNWLSYPFGYKEV